GGRRRFGRRTGGRPGAPLRRCARLPHHLAAGQPRRADGRPGARAAARRGRGPPSRFAVEAEGGLVASARAARLRGRADARTPRRAPAGPVGLAPGVRPPPGRARGRAMSDDALRPPPRELPERQRQALHRAERLCWWTLLWMSLVSALMFAAMGGSQAMKTALVEDLLSLVPAIAFLVASRFRRKGVDAEYITGRERAFDINFLISAVALAGVGLALVYDGLHTLLTATRPVVGSIVVAGHVIWQGWVMIAVLAVSAVPPIIPGRKKLKLARQLSLKPLHTDADMGKADWMTALAGIAGVAGIGFGLWWADAVAALVIAGSILHDGASNLRGAVRDLHDARPQELERDAP